MIVYMCVYVVILLCICQLLYVDNQLYGWIGAIEMNHFYLYVCAAVCIVAGRFILMSWVSGITRLGRYQSWYLGEVYCIHEPSIIFVIAIITTAITISLYHILHICSYCLQPLCDHRTGLITNWSQSCPQWLLTSLWPFWLQEGWSYCTKNLVATKIFTQISAAIVLVTRRSLAPLTSRFFGPKCAQSGLKQS